MIFVNNKYKEPRNKEYFGKFLKRGLNPDNTEDSKKVDRDTRIKIEDRIHNTTTLSGFGIGNIDKIFRKIDETLVYFLPITQRYHPDLHKKLIEELERVLEWLLLEIPKSNLKERKNLIKNIIRLKGRINKFKLVKQQTHNILNAV